MSTVRRSHSNVSPGNDEGRRPEPTPFERPIALWVS